MNTFSNVEKSLLTQLQRGIEVTSRPFEGLDLPEDEVIALLHRAKESGLLRRFGSVFDSRRLGYRSILVALDVPEELLEEKAAIVSALPGVTHCYERKLFRGEGTFPKLWFTLAVLSDEYTEEVARLRKELSPGVLYELPALERFKIDVVFNLQDGPRAKTGSRIHPQKRDDEISFKLTEDEKALVRAVDQQIPLVARPFAAIADQIGQTEEFVLSTLKSWKTHGVMRRVGAILYHHQAGFKANAMCVWPVATDEMKAAGGRVASRPEVTHCYQRPRVDVFPFDLYAMIHSGSWDETEAIFKDICERCELSDGALFASGREFKKSSMLYFR